MNTKFDSKNVIKMAFLQIIYLATVFKDLFGRKL